MTMVDLHSDNFELEALKSDLPVLVDFWAPWCGPCKLLSPLVDEIGMELEGTVKIGKVNVDEAQDLAKTYSVMSIPTLILFQSGGEVGRLVGVRPKGDIMKLLGMD